MATAGEQLAGALFVTLLAPVITVYFLLSMCEVLFSLVGPVELSFSRDNCGRCKMYVT